MISFQARRFFAKFVLRRHGTFQVREGQHLVFIFEFSVPFCVPPRPRLRLKRPLTSYFSGVESSRESVVAWNLRAGTGRDRMGWDENEISNHEIIPTGFGRRDTEFSSDPISPPPTDISSASKRHSPSSKICMLSSFARIVVDLQTTDLSSLAQRPCSRCLSNGKEDACVDVQHKKRGRPRLREEPRYAVEPSYPPPESMRRPLSLYGPDTAVSTPFSDALHRSGSYRVLKSQGGIGGPIASRYPEHQTPPENPSLYGGSMTPNTRIPLLPQEPICAYLTMEMQVAKSTKVFEETIGVQPVTSRNLQDIVSPSDRDKVFRLQRLFDDERRVREPNYLPPIYLKYEEDRVIQSVGFGPEDVRQPEADRSEMITFQSPDGQQRTFQLRFGLAKKESTYFVVVVIDVPTTPQPFHPSSSPYTREPYHRDPQYGYHPQSGYQPSHPPTRFMPNPPYGEPQPSVPSYRTPGSLSSNMSPFLQASSQRSDYVQGQSNPYQTPRSEGHIQGQSIVQTQSQTQAHSQRQRDLQLPPIRDQRGGDELSGRRDDRARFDIGGLLENPDPSGRSQ